MSEISLSPTVPAMVLAETRHAVLSQPERATAAPGVPVVIVKPLTAPNHAYSFADEARLQAMLNAAGHPVVTVSWRTLWSEGAKERFAPRVNDLATLVSAYATHGSDLHLAAIGNGAIITLKWLARLVDVADQSGQDRAQNALSLTLISPEMHVFGRTPRTTLKGAPKASCVIADASRADVESAQSLARKLSDSPLFALAHDHSSFLLSEENPAPEAGLLDMASIFEGDWRLSWADWLHRVRIAQLA